MQLLSANLHSISNHSSGNLSASTSALRKTNEMVLTQARTGPGLRWKDIILPTPGPSREPSRARLQIQQQPEQLQDPEPTPPPDPSEQTVTQYLAQAQVQQEKKLQAGVQRVNPAQQPVKRGPGRPKKRKLSPSAKYSHVKVHVVPTAAQAEYLRRQQIQSQSQNGRQSHGRARTAVPADKIAVDGEPAVHQTGRQVQRFPNCPLPQPSEVNNAGYVQPRVRLDQSFFARAQHSRASSHPSHVPSRYQQAVQQQQQQQPQRPAVQRKVSLTIPNAAQQASGRLLQELQAPWSFPPAQARQLLPPQTQTQQIVQTKSPSQPDPPDASSSPPETRSIASPLIRSTRKRKPKPSLKARENAELEEAQVSLVSQQSRLGSRGSVDEGDQLANNGLGDFARDARPRARESRARDKGKGIATDSLAPVHLARVGEQMIRQAPGSVEVDIGGARANEQAEEQYEAFPLLGMFEEGEMANGQRGPVQLITGKIVDPSFTSYSQARGAIAESTPALHYRQSDQHPKPRNQTRVQPEPEPEPGLQPKPKPRSSSRSHPHPRRLTHTASQHHTLPRTTTRWWNLGLKTFTEHNTHTGTSSDRVILRSGVEPNTLAYWFDRALCGVASRFGRSGSAGSVLPEICLGLLRAREKGDVAKMVSRRELVALVVGREEGAQRPALKLLPLHQVHVGEGEVVVAVVVGEEPEYGMKSLMTAEREFEEKTTWDVLLDEVKVEAKVWKDFRRYKAFEALKSYARLAKLEYISREVEGRLNLGQQPANAVGTRWMRKVEIEKVTPPGRVLRSKPVEEKVQVDGRVNMKMVFAQFQILRTVSQARAETRLKLRLVNKHILDRAEARLKLRSVMAQIRAQVRIIK